jgi:hypothetical protein
MSIIYNCYDFASSGMAEYRLNFNDILKYLPKKCKVNTNIKAHCNDVNEFVINVMNGKVTNPLVFEKINKYLADNNTRSYFYEGLVSAGNGYYAFYWGS